MTKHNQLLQNIKKQLKDNLLAILSVLIAISALAYNSWRNEASEENRNYRSAGFEIMREAAHLQYLVDTATYSESSQKYDVINGWVKVNLILSLSELMMPDVKVQATNLKQVWDENGESLNTNVTANENISAANIALINSVNKHLKGLQ